MSKKLKILIIVPFIVLSLYYLVSIFLNNNKFVNHYFFPSSSIETSKELDLFLNKVDFKDIEIDGDEQFKKLTDSLVIWYDISKSKKSYGMFNLFSREKINNEGKILRISYINPHKWLNKKNNLYVGFGNNKKENLSFTNGHFFLNNDEVIIEFYDEINADIAIGRLKLK
jgi:hypothetical protein